MHVSLDSALGRQRRLNSVGESVLQIAPNAAAAYSLRSLTGGDPKVVRVRRSSGGEQDFTASEVASGAMLSYVTEARTGWNIQATFNDTPDGTATITSASSTATTSTVSFTGSGTIRVLPKSNYVAAEAGDQVVFNMSVSGLDSSMTFRIRKASSNTTVGTASVSNGDNQDVTLDLTASSGYTGGYPHFTADAGSGEATVTINSVTVNGKSGFVDTWYDQSGNGNDAVQATAGSQPKIVSAGALVTGGLDFDGTAHQLTLSNTLGITSAASHFAVTNLNDAGGADILLDNRDSSTDGYSIRTNDTSNINFDWLTSDAEVARISGQSVYYFNKTSSQVQSGANGGTLVTASESGSVSVAVTPRIGARSFISATNFLEGTINELIIYNTDQTDNRTAIEANINSHYSIF